MLGLYIDGILIDEVAGTGDVGPNDKRRLVIGGRDTTSNDVETADFNDNVWIGLLDEFRVIDGNVVVQHREILASRPLVCRIGGRGVGLFVRSLASVKRREVGDSVFHSQIILFLMRRCREGERAVGFERDDEDAFAKLGNAIISRVEYF